MALLGGRPARHGCGHGPGLHLSDDLLIVEPVDSDGRRVPPGERSAKIYVTNLYNPVLPLIRYEITDEVTPLFDLCPCGSAHRLVADIHGRLDDAFRYPSGVAVHAHVFRAALCHPDIIEYQVRQTPRGAHLSLRAGTIDIDALRRTLTQGLRTAGLDDPELDIDIVDEIPRQGTGKLKRFTPLA